MSGIVINGKTMDGAAISGTTPLLSIRGLTVSFPGASRQRLHAVRGLDLTIEAGEVVAVVGESGSGKSTTAHAITGLLPAGGRIDDGEIRFGGLGLHELSGRQLRAIRGRQIGLIPQDPTVSLNPIQRIGIQVAEALLVHGLADRRTAAVRAVKLLERAGISEAASRARQYPHELSGGLRQRVLIAIAIAAEPKLIVADEPTSALDVTVQRRILDHLDQLREELGTALLLITHDLAVAADRAQRIVVMSNGTIVETGPTAQILTAPQHPYTQQLLRNAPALASTRVGSLRLRSPAVNSTSPVTPLVVVSHLVKSYPLPSVGRNKSTVTAVDDVSFRIPRGETLALVGESGSGKSTTARLVLRLTDPESGTVSFDGQDITGLRGSRLRALRRRMQLIYQNPYASLDPRFTVEEVIGEPLRVFGVGSRAERRARVAELTDRVALPTSTLRRRPVELSGGQRQRVAIARALALSPDLVVCDEPVSALDVSVQAQVLELLARLQADLGVSYLFISHDLAVVRQIAHTVGVMQAGRLVELGPAEHVFQHPSHAYTEELLASVPGPKEGTNPKEGSYQ